MMISKFFVVLLALTGAVAAFADLDGNGEDDRQPQQQQRRVVTQRQQQPQQRVVQPPAPQYQEDTFEQLRNINGRVDLLENQIGQLNALNSGEKAEVAKAKKELDTKFIAYEEALKKMEMQITALNEEVTKMREEMANRKPEEPKKPESKPGKGKSAAVAAFEEAEALLAQKKWREAIIAYEDYRKAAPKGKSVADATYKIGVCMQEVGMKAEAKLFFDEVISKFPGSKEAKKAAFRLKSLK